MPPDEDESDLGAGVESGDHREAGRDPPTDPLEGGHAVRTERLEERKVWLDRGGVRTGRLHDQQRERFDAGEVRREPVWQRGGIGIQAETQNAADSR